jgi:flagellar protein FliO/FliZ
VDFSTYFRFLFALVFVLALIGILAWAARRYGFLRGTVRPRNGERRLEVIEIAPVDSKRRLLLLRRDRTEHLVLLGPTADVVIESGIERSGKTPARGEAAE